MYIKQKKSKQEWIGVFGQEYVCAYIGHAYTTHLYRTLTQKLQNKNTKTKKLTT